jgi:hypothetical protein
MADNFTLQQGSKEFMLVDVIDDLQNLTSLSGASGQYRVIDFNSTQIVAWTTIQSTTSYVNAIGQTVMRAFCLLDSGTGGQGGSVWSAGDYRIYLKFVTGLEAPILGPYHFTVSNA